MALAVSQWITCNVTYTAAAGIYWLAYTQTTDGNYRYAYSTGTGTLGYHCEDTLSSFPNNPFPDIATKCNGGDASDRSAYVTMTPTTTNYGTTSVGGSSAAIATNRTEAKKVVLPAGSVTALSAYYVYIGPSEAATAKLALYADDGGKPSGAPLASCTASMALAVSQWITCNVTYTATAATYWLAYTQTTDGNYRYAYTTGTGTLGYHCEDTLSSFPNNPFPVVATKCNGGDASDRSAYVTMF
jgi:hypothetical protein